MNRQPPDQSFDGVILQIITLIQLLLKEIWLYANPDGVANRKTKQYLTDVLLGHGCSVFFWPVAVSMQEKVVEEGKVRVQ